VRWITAAAAKHLNLRVATLPRRGRARARALTPPATSANWPRQRGAVTEASEASATLECTAYFNL